ncbi:glycosyltransferase family 2 protein [Halobellus ordinarius]|uniref:glycosyltransferase family 2 protein n=1 Tax=Halobellus ordinarius TaxID=3075120 RepID=UPI002880A210|nr:glycosyltransferase family 2 protein [Halobellus sp. ZY16]
MASTKIGVTDGVQTELTVTEPKLERGGDSVLVGADSAVDPVISVVMPTMNEEEGIGECIQRVTAALEQLGVVGEIIISDDSSDRTPEIARDMGAIVVNPDEEGYGYAYRYAFEHARGEYIVIGDADTTYDFEQIPRLLDPIVGGNADIVMGSRLDGEIKPGAMPALHKYVGNPLLTKFLNLFYEVGVSDAHSGFRVFRADVLDTLDLETTGMEFASEMVMEAGVCDLTIEEVPIVYHEREGEATLESFRDGWRHVRFMILNAPSYLFSLPGVAMGIVGSLVMLLALLGIELGPATFGPRTMIAGSLLSIVGYQVSSMGVFATLAGNPIRRPSDRGTEFIIENVTLERAALVGNAIGLLGALYAGQRIYTWIVSGFGALSILTLDVLAFTAVVIGIQTVFGAFFMSAVAPRRD